jgi:hypothetical protein
VLLLGRCAFCQLHKLHCRWSIMILFRCVC